MSNVETLVRDAQTLDLHPDSFDATICRSGLMLMNDPVAALVRIRRALKPGGRLAALVFGRAANNPLQWLPTSIARRIAGLPPPSTGEPGMFALGEPGAIEAAFQAAGFHDVTVQTVMTSRRFPSAAEAARSLHDTLPSVHAILRRVAEPERMRVWAKIELALRDFEGQEGLVVSGESLLGVGSKERVIRGS